MFSFRHCPNEGGEALAELKNTLYIFLLTAEKDVQVARNGGRGGGPQKSFKLGRAQRSMLPNLVVRQ